MRCTTMRALVLVRLVSLSVALNGSQIVHDLGSVLTPESSIYLPTDPNWVKETTQRFDFWQAPTYIVSIKPAVKEDVQKVVQYAAQNDVPFLATAGGHGYSGSLGALHNGIELDMGYFNSVSVDASTNLLTIGGSVRFSDLMGPCYSAGKAIPVGACSCVGMSGASLGGGIGFYSGMYGAISDSLASVDMVIANGTLITASEHENKELFWAIKGAGFNFGVVTSFTYNTYDYPNAGQAMTADMTFPATQNGTLWAFAKSWIGRQPKELSITFSILFDPASQQLLIITNIIYVGPLSEGKSLIQPLLDLNPQNTNISYLPWKDVPDAANYGQPGKACLETNVTTIPYTLNLYQIDIEGLSAAINVLSDSIAATPALQSYLVAFTQYATYGFQLHADSSSVFPYRDVILYAQIAGTVMNPEDNQAVDSFGRTFRDMLLKISGKDQLEVYTNFAYGDEGPVAWYTEKNVPRLIELKKKYDPDSLFSFFNPVG